MLTGNYFDEIEYTKRSKYIHNTVYDNARPQMIEQNYADDVSLQEQQEYLRNGRRPTPTNNRPLRHPWTMTIPCLKNARKTHLAKSRETNGPNGASDSNTYTKTPKNGNSKIRSIAHMHLSYIPCMTTNAKQ